MANQWCGNFMMGHRHVFRMNHGEYAKPLLVTSGVKQDCIMAQIMFSIMFFAMITRACQDCDAGYPTRYRFDDKLFNKPDLRCRPSVVIRQNKVTILFLSVRIT